MVEAIKNISISVPQPLDVNCTTEIPQPLEVSGNISCQSNIPQPLQVTGSLSVPQPLEISGTITCNSSGSTDPCTEAIIKILSQSSSFTEIVFKNDEQFQNAENVTVDGNILSFTSQNQKVQAPVCNVEYVVL